MEQESAELRHASTPPPPPPPRPSSGGRTLDSYGRRFQPFWHDSPPPSADGRPASAEDPAPTPRLSRPGRRLLLADDLLPGGHPAAAAGKAVEGDGSGSEGEEDATLWSFELPAGQGFSHSSVFALPRMADMQVLPSSFRCPAPHLSSWVVPSHPIRSHESCSGAPPHSA
jgi:hypothetical protein